MSIDVAVRTPPLTNLEVGVTSRFRLSTDNYRRVNKPLGQIAAPLLGSTVNKLEWFMSTDYSVVWERNTWLIHDDQAKLTMTSCDWVYHASSGVCSHHLRVLAQSTVVLIKRGENEILFHFKLKKWGGLYFIDEKKIWHTLLTKYSKIHYVSIILQRVTQLMCKNRICYSLWNQYLTTCCRSCNVVKYNKFDLVNYFYIFMSICSVF